jgi:putative PIN family toxin of toxin-antitoxin system
MRERIVIDTNVYVSRLLRESSVPGRAVGLAWREFTTLISTEAWEELRIVLMRRKFARYIQPVQVESYLGKVWEFSEHIVNPSPIRACRDARDDKFIEVAVHGRADVILTGDEDLLALNPFCGIAILTPGEFLERR